MWDLHGPGLEPVSPALTGGFSTTVPPGKPITKSLVQCFPGQTLGSVPSGLQVFQAYFSVRLSFFFFF